MMENTSELLSCAVSAARAAGTHAAENRNRRFEIARRFSHDVKLQLDREAQEKAEGVIGERFPGHSVLGEETAARELEGDMVWVVDPIDGTVNFFHGLPQWCSSVAVRRGSTVLAGAVYAPDMDLCYTAALDNPAMCNDVNLAVSGIERLDEAMICTGIDKESEGHPGSFELLRRLSMSTQKVRVMGSAALDVCNVAHGRTDAYYEGGIYVWDVAAAGLIVRQAGGATTILEEGAGHRLRFLASTPAIHDPLKEIIEELAPRI